ncbi:MAG: AFG1/ZapE family ATPase [Gammaproteobacteria bacterium]
MTPTERYRRDLDGGAVLPDTAQQLAVRHTQRIYEDLSRDGRERGSLLRELWGRFGGWRALRGLYLWGGVGRGKTYLMDTLFECLPFADKRRAHFHRFMQAIHRDLKSLRDLAACRTHIER